MSRKANNRMELDRYLNQVAVTILKTTVITVCVGYLLEIIIYHKSNPLIFLINLATISITLFVFFLYHFKKINLKLSLYVIVSTIIVNVIVDTFINSNAPDRLSFFLRDSLFIILALTIVALIASKIHVIIINVLYIAIIIVFALITKSKFLQSIIYINALFVTAFSILINYFVKVLEKTIIYSEGEKNIINEENLELNEINTLLKERQQQIEEQTEDLHSQTEYLEQVKTELEELNKSKDKFFSIISHDLRSPFNTIFGFAEVLQQKKDTLTDQKKDQYISAIYTSAKKVYVLLENLLQWSRTQTNHIQFEPRNFHIKEIAEDIYQLQKENLRLKAIQYEKRIEDDFNVFADYEMIQVVLRNLISNAIKFTPNKGKITLEIKKVENQIELLVADTGVGISDEDMKNLFIIDKTVTSDGTDGERGSGLGLILCKEFVEKNGGKIWVTSKKGKGSTFTFSLPVSE